MELGKKESTWDHLQLPGFLMQMRVRGDKNPSTLALLYLNIRTRTHTLSRAHIHSTAENRVLRNEDTRLQRVYASLNSHCTYNDASCIKTSTFNLILAFKNAQAVIGHMHHIDHDDYHNYQQFYPGS